MPGARRAESTKPCFPPLALAPNLASLGLRTKNLESSGEPMETGMGSRTPAWQSLESPWCVVLYDASLASSRPAPTWSPARPKHQALSRASKYLIGFSSSISAFLPCSTGV